MQYYNDTLCVSGSDLYAIISKPLYDKLSRDGYLNVVKRGCYKNPALIEFDKIRPDIKAKLIEKFGDPREKADVKPFRDSIKPDPKALEYFTAFRLEDGRALPTKNITDYCNDAAILNALHEVITGMQVRRAALGGTVKKFWHKALQAVNNLKTDYPCSLPSSEKRLKERYNNYMDTGYEALISKKFCNNNSRKVTDQIENLILSLYTMPNKPYATSVRDMYTMFINGKLKVVDEKTGEIYNNKDFFQDGKAIELSETTVWNYINNGINRIIVDSKRSGRLEFKSLHSPHHNRHVPNYSFSKISMDDRDMRKTRNGQRVKAYFSYDVLSGCVIGKAYSKDKDRTLFLDCMRDMFRLIDKNGFDMPVEVEVENHLVNTFADGLMQAGNVFPMIRWCNPENSQEKRAEHKNREKKYSVEKDNQVNIGRFYAKLEANRVKTEYNKKERMYSMEEIIADDLKAIKAFNNQLHPNKEKYPNKTRWQVLVENLNPNCPKIDKAILYRFIGDVTSTTLRRSQYCQVQGAKYQIENLEVIDRLVSNNYKVDAYYMPDNEGVISNVYLYQNDVFIGIANKITTYNEATCEQTDADREAYTEQAKYVSKFYKMVKDGKESLSKPYFIESEEFEELESIPVETVDIIESGPFDNNDEMQDYEDFYSPENIRKMAIEQL